MIFANLSGLDDESWQYRLLVGGGYVLAAALSIAIIYLAYLVRVAEFYRAGSDFGYNLGLVGGLGLELGQSGLHQVGGELVAQALFGFRAQGALAAEHDRDDPMFADLRGRHDRGVGGFGPAGLEPVAAREGIQQVVMVQHLHRLQRPS